MSEYQYYEFEAIDRPLSEADRRALRAFSTRARITTTSFTNTYDFGDFGGDPAKLMERWFDLHLYLANGGSRQLMIRLPTRLVDRHRIEDFLGDVECTKLRVAGENLILNIVRDELDTDWDDGTRWLAVLAPLRADLLAGDLRALYLLWLTEVEAGVLDADEPEPMPGIGPMTAALEAFAEFFCIDPDLVQAAAERSSANTVSTDAGRRVIAAMPDGEKTKLLARLFEGDPHVAAELRADVRKRLEPKPEAPSGVRTVGDLVARAEAIGLAREKAKAAKTAAEQIRAAQEAEKVRRTRIDAIARRGESVWREVECEIERRDAKGYDKAAGLLGDLQALANERGTIADFDKRLRAIQERHSSKRRFVERLAAIRL
jgi:hypothetical protein